MHVRSWMVGDHHPPRPLQLLERRVQLVGRYAQRRCYLGDERGVALATVQDVQNLFGQNRHSASIGCPSCQCHPRPLAGGSSKMRIAVDIGGTFTDVTLYDESNGAVRLGK